MIQLAFTTIDNCPGADTLINLQTISGIHPILPRGVDFKNKKEDHREEWDQFEWTQKFWENFKTAKMKQLKEEREKRNEKGLALPDDDELDEEINADDLTFPGLTEIRYGGGQQVRVFGNPSDIHSIIQQVVQRVNQQMQQRIVKAAPGVAVK